MLIYMEKIMKINVEFDTLSKVLGVSIDGKKVKNISEVRFFGFDANKGAVEIRQSESLEDDKAHKITTVMAGSGDTSYSSTITIEAEASVPCEDIAKRLFPHKTV